MNNTSPTRVTSGFRRWHRKLGLAAIPLILILLSTGILLNHGEDLDLATIPLSYGLLQLVYGVPADEDMLGFSVGGHWLTGQGNRLILNSTPFAECSQPLKGAVAQGGFLVALCSDSLFLVTPAGQLVERLGESHGLPQPLRRIGSVVEGDADSVFLKVEKDIWKLNLASLLSSKLNGSIEAVEWSKPEAYPKELLKKITADLIVDDINLERLLLDIHSGRVLGTGGVLLVDFVAVLMAILALSGFVMWVKKR